MSKKTYFLAPTRATPPDGPIVLGNVIASPLRPEHAINGDPPPPFLNKNEPYSTQVTDWKNERERAQCGSGGIWAKFLQFLGAGGNGSLSIKSSKCDVYEFDKLTTTYFVPSTRYVTRSLEDPEVQDYMHYNPSGRLYMITGIKVASGATVALEKAREWGLSLQVGVDMTILGVPITAGPEVRIARSSREKESFSMASDFVFAYQLIQIKYKRKKMKSHTDYTRGAMFGIDDNQPAKHDDDEDEFELAGLADAESFLPGLGLRKIDAEENDGSNITCIVPP
ncbi:hypothetical protein MBLNU459_g1133t1 [Dothideomycetes sp. NU459]